MSNFLFLVDKYLPDPSSNGVVANNIIECLTKKGHKVYILTIYNSVGIRVFSINNKENKITFLNKVFGYCQNQNVVRELFKKAKSICNSVKIDAVLSIFKPVETVICGEMIKKNIGIRHILFALDVPSLNSSSNIKKTLFDFNFKRLFKKHLNKDLIISLKYYFKYFDRIDKKHMIEYVGTPNLTMNYIDDVRTENTINLVYAGSFYEKIRNPKKMLEAMKFIVNTNIYLHLYSWGCEDIVNYYKNIYGQNLILHGKKTLDEVKQAFAHSNILINLSNYSEFQVPGKVMEYYSFCRPVINFIFRADDPGLEEYEKYPLSLIVDLTKHIETSEILLFINNKKETSLMFDTINDLFYDSTPEYFANLLEKALDS